MGSAATTWDIPQEELDGLDLTLSDSGLKPHRIAKPVKETEKLSKMLKGFGGIAVNVLAVTGWLLVFAFIFDTLFLNSRILTWFIAG